MAVESLYREPEAADDEIAHGALEFHDVFKIFRSGPAETVALRGLDLRIEQHELVAVFGPSGSGKSTIVRDGWRSARPESTSSAASTHASGTHARWVITLVRWYGSPVSGSTRCSASSRSISSIDASAVATGVRPGA